jgi:hypothetical protein
MLKITTQMSSEKKGTPSTKTNNYKLLQDEIYFQNIFKTRYNL